jgi:hypothetical protein
VEATFGEDGDGGVEDLLAAQLGELGLEWSAKGAEGVWSAKGAKGREKHETRKREGRLEREGRGGRLEREGRERRLEREGRERPRKTRNAKGEKMKEKTRMRTANANRECELRMRTANAC